MLVDDWEGLIYSFYLLFIFNILKARNTYWSGSLPVLREWKPKQGHLEYKILNEFHLRRIQNDSLLLMHVHISMTMRDSGTDTAIYWINCRWIRLLDSRELNKSLRKGWIYKFNSLFSPTPVGLSLKKKMVCNVPRPNC